MQVIPLLAAALLLSVLPATAAERTVSVFVELEGASMAELSLQDGGAARLANVRPSALQRRQEIHANQASMARSLDALEGRVTARYVNAVNALRVRIPESRLADLARLPGIKRVQRAHLYRPHTSSSVPWIGAPAVWARAAGGFTGEGIRVGVIDSGIDYLHADFGGSGKTSDFTANDPKVIEPGSFPTAKVVGGTDFVGDDYDASDPLHDIPEPDPDPLDTRANGHGSHVAGILAGLGVTTNGVAYTGSYDGPINPNFAIGPGVAPKASLYALKVFGSGGPTDAVVDGLDWALDPNDDGDLSDRLDVIVLSLGDYFGIETGDDLELEAISRLSQLGCVVAISAGNEGNTSYILASPGISPRAITVANSVDNGTSDNAIEVTAPPDLAGRYQAEEGVFTPPLSSVGPISGKLVAVDPDDACDPLSNTAQLKGNIALITRGTCFFADKIRAAQTAGAIAVVMVNNIDDPPVVGMSASGDTSDIAIPGVMITKADGARLRARLDAGVTVTLSANLIVAHTDFADRLDSSTSRGPVFRSNRLKPDIAAPGTKIQSAKSGSGSEGIVFSGTSMSAPHVAGAAALLRQAHPTWSSEDIKSALLNTAVPTRDAEGDRYPESRTGSGRVQVDTALLTTVVAHADAADGAVSVSFGTLELESPFATNRLVRVMNHGVTAATLQLSSSNTVVETGVVVRPVLDSITVPPNGSATFEIRLEADPSQFTGTTDPTSPSVLDDVPRRQFPESSGEIWLKGDGLAIHLPWYAVLRATSRFSATALTIGAPMTSGDPVALPTRGTTGHPQPVVSVFQLGATDNNQRFTDYRSATDLIAIGAATDYAVSGSISNTTLYFGMGMAGHWLTPQRAENNYDIEIDLNNDGRVDFTVINANSGTFNAGDVDAYEDTTEALLTVVRDEDTGDLVSEWPYYLLDPAYRDMSPYLNGVLVHAVQAADIGLTETKTTFRYRAVTDAEYGDQTSWVTFNAAKPVIDPTPYGLQGSPYFDEGRGVAVALNRANAGTATSTRVLLLHQHNVAGTQSEIVTLELGSADTDNDGLPDAWELRQFGDLSFGGADDPDGDGVNNAAEAAANTPPFEVRLLTTGAADGTLRWVSPAGRFVTIERATDPAGEYVAIQRHIPTVAGANAFRDPGLTGPHGPFFYRLQME